MSPSISPQQFVNQWRAVEQKERSIAQSHFNALCQLIGQQTPLEVDPKGEWFAFEVGANKTTGGDGFADVWKRGYFAWEYKGKHGNLDAAVAVAYGWPPNLPDEEISARLLALNMERAAMRGTT